MTIDKKTIEKISKLARLKLSEQESTDLIKQFMFSKSGNDPKADWQALQERLQAIAHLKPQPEVHVRGDARADFEAVGRVVYACQQAGITRIGFITEPPAAGAR